MRPIVIRRTAKAAREAWESSLTRVGGNPHQWQPLLGEPGTIADSLRPFATIGFRHVVCSFPSADDRETIERIQEVRDLLD